MLEEILGWICGTYSIVILVFMLWWNFMRLFYIIKCHKVKHCSQQKCCCNICCSKYEEVPADEEIQELQELLNKLKKERQAKW